MYGGLAVAEVIFGVTAPAGRLTQTWYKHTFVNEVLMADMNMRPNATGTNPGRGYRYFTGEVVYPFGFGLSYTEFNCSKLTVAQNNGRVVSLTVTNVGTVQSSAVVLVFWRPLNSGVPLLKRLVAFGRVNLLSAKESKEVTMDLYEEFVRTKEMNNGGAWITGGVCSSGS